MSNAAKKPTLPVIDRMPYSVSLIAIKNVVLITGTVRERLSLRRSSRSSRRILQFFRQLLIHD